MDSGVARRPIGDMAAYARSLEARIKASHDRILPFIDSYQK